MITLLENSVLEKIKIKNFVINNAFTKEFLSLMFAKDFFTLLMIIILLITIIVAKTVTTFFIIFLLILLIFRSKSFHNKNSNFTIFIINITSIDVFQLDKSFQIMIAKELYEMIRFTSK